MDYKAAYIKLYGAAGAAIEKFFEARVETKEHSEAIAILREAIDSVEKMMDEDGEDEPEPPQGSYYDVSGVLLTPSDHGALCAGNGKHEGVECCCDECNDYLTCFPDWKERASIGV